MKYLIMIGLPHVLLWLALAWLFPKNEVQADA